VRLLSQKIHYVLETKRFREMRRAWHSRGRRSRRRLCSHPWILFWKREVYRFHMLPARWLYRAPSIRSPAEILFAPRTIPGRTGNVNRSSDERSKYVTAGASSLILSRFASVLPNSIRIARSRRYGVTLKPGRHHRSDGDCAVRLATSVASKKRSSPRHK
jgi:hypothetical protein